MGALAKLGAVFIILVISAIKVLRFMAIC